MRKKRNMEGSEVLIEQQLREHEGEKKLKSFAYNEAKSSSGAKRGLDSILEKKLEKNSLFK